MEPTSAPAHRGAVPWCRLLLTASLFIFWSPPTTAQQVFNIDVETVPPDAVEGMNVLLHVRNLPEKFSRLEWFREEQLPENQIATLKPNPEIKTDGRILKGRTKIYSNGSLEIQNVAVGDFGPYLIKVITVNGDKYGRGELRVHVPVTLPSIKSSHSIVIEEEGPVVLTCLTNDTQVSIQWRLNNKDLQSTEMRKISANNRTLTLQTVTVADEGDYECVVSNAISSHTSGNFRLQVTPSGGFNQEPPPIIPPGSFKNFFGRKGKTI